MQGDTWPASVNLSEDANAISAFKRGFRLAHQTLCITHVDFDQKLLVGFTQLTIWPTLNSLRHLFVNCRQCRIHRLLLEAADSSVVQTAERSLSTASTNKLSSKLNRIPFPLDLPVIYNDPAVEICNKDSKLRTLDSFQRRHTCVVDQTDPNKDAGEIIIRIPPEFWPFISSGRPIRITLEFSLNKPKSGFYFIVPEGEGSVSDRGVHAFTASVPHCSRLWFPCVDCSEPCTWKIEVTVEEDMVVVAPGELVDAPYYTEDLTHKTFHFFLATPVAAPYIGIAIGAFEVYPDPVLPNTTTHFCPSGLLPLLKHTILHVSEILEYYEAILASQYPFTTMKTVFVDRAYNEFQAFASLIIFPVDVLYSARIIDQAIETRKLMATAIATQFFGCFLTMQTWCDSWLTIGLAQYLSGLYQKRVFGNNEYRRMILKEMHHVTAYEHAKHGILLDPSKSTSKITHFGLTSPHTISPNYLVAFTKKAHLIIRMLELRFGQPVLLQVLNKLLVLGRLSAASIFGDDPVTHREASASVDSSESLSSRCVNKDRINDVGPPACLTDEHQANLVLSTISFRRIISMVTGQDIQNFLDQWVYNFGHVRLFAKFHFNRKRNVVELELKQDLQSRGTLNYTGPLTVLLQELDGAFNHTFKLEEGRTLRDLPCHSKSRKHRKKRIPLANGEEVDMDLSRIDSESPLLWIRLDPDLAIVHTIYIDQPDFMWHLMLLHDRDCLGQLEAADALRDFPSPETRHALVSVIANERLFYRLRIDACFVLCHIANETSAAHSGTQNSTSNAAISFLLPIFWQLFSSPAARGLIRQNTFKNLQHYFFMRAICSSLSTLRVQQVCPREVLPFLTELLRLNDNSRNTYSDCYYRADLIRAMRDTLTPAIVARGVIAASSLPTEARTVVEEVVHHLNLESQILSFKGTVTVACLTTLRRLQRLGFLPVDSSLFYTYASPGFYHDIRIAALECLVDFVRGERDQAALDWIFDEIIERDDGTDASYARLRFETVRLLIRIPPFQRNETGSRLDTPQLVERLWNLMNYGCAADSRLRAVVADLYHILYGNRRPTCLPLPEGVLLVRVKEGRSVVNLAGSQPKSDYVADGEEFKSSTSASLQALSGANAQCLHEEIGDDVDDAYSDFDPEVFPVRAALRQTSSTELVRSVSHGSLSGLGSGSVSRISTAADCVGPEGDSSSIFSMKRTFPFHSGADLSASDSNPKRRLQRLSDDEDD